MKKLLVLALVCGIASLATAGMQIVPGLEYDIVGDTVTISATSPVIAFSLAILSPDAGTLTPVSQGLAAGGIGSAPADLGLTTYPAGAIAFASGTTGSATGKLGVIYSFTFSPEVQMISILNDTEWGAANSDVTFQGGETVSLAGIQIVPEPATLALLGLGALVLRRKK